ncbi:MAG TPA: polyhydroxyalkanoic acid system family protein [Pseudomonadota bacterium]|nr:polyhydroxyalkanoic acid system family protein [Pseudomonadota bacterium]
MPKVEISHKHAVTAAEAKQKLQQLSQDLSDKYGLTSKWTSDTEAKVERTGASGTIRIEPNLIKVVLDLSFALTPIKGTVEEKIKKELTKLFG